MTSRSHVAAAFVATLLACSSAWSQSVKGTFSGRFAVGSTQFSFSCTGSPTCVGSYSAIDTWDFCSNTFALLERIVFTGLDLSRPGSIQGTVTLGNYDYSISTSGGACTVVPG